ncbi:hypothetical protein J7E50_10810 [Pedobacter sp. ISL-68]|uniref:hypothetical protein n=1 Tax=unclassified Pedobacter TaxID=2628915 RepID=UPI001BE4FEBE|nr:MULTISPECIES: hypothetical protein [unclassified Pedobacter]MBT2561322.1 hypothetical protein [Pedobacter sp. ISL-64]MBT2590711.1 hypothetical protein [Pedobacter sp. ISL-68]
MDQIKMAAGAYLEILLNTGKIENSGISDGYIISGTTKFKNVLSITQIFIDTDIR